MSEKIRKMVEEYKLSKLGGFSEDTYCPLPWSSITIDPTGNFKICCFSGAQFGITDDSRSADHGLAYDSNNQPLNILTHTIKEALNSKDHKELRLAQSKNKRHPTCEVCWTRDDAAKASKTPSLALRGNRASQSRLWDDPSILIENVSKKMKSDGSLHEDDLGPVSLDLRLSNLCNMKCLMCDSKYSSLWVEDDIALGKMQVRHGMKFYDIVSKSNNKPIVDSVPWHDSPKFWKEIDDLSPRLRHIYLTGGEPFLVPSHDELLDRLISGGYASNITLEYDTNLSVIRPKTLNKLKLFKDVILAVSSDDVEDRYELIRFPGRWNTLFENISKIKESGIPIARITTCIAPYNVYAPMRLRKTFPNDKLNTRILRAPMFLNIKRFGPKAKKQILNEYEKHDTTVREYSLVSGYLKNVIDTPYNEIELLEFVDYMDKLDVIRGTDWKSVTPETVELFALDGLKL